LECGVGGVQLVAREGRVRVVVPRGVRHGRPVIPLE
jgi:hypothetical protein